jgi:hypothetical protein
LFRKEIAVKEFYEHMSQKFQLPKSSCKSIMKEMEKQGVAKVNWHNNSGAKIILKRYVDI